MKKFAILLVMLFAITNLSGLQIIPLNDGALDVTRIDDTLEALGATPTDNEKLWLLRYKEEFDYYFKDGATEAQLEERLEELKNALIEKKK